MTNNTPMNNNSDAGDANFNLDNNQDSSLGSLQQEGKTSRREWISPQLREYGTLSFVVKGISYRPSDGISNLT